MMAKNPKARPVIAHVLHRLYLAGAEVLAAALARRLRDRYDFIFLCLDEVGPLGMELRGDGFEVIDLERKPGVDWSVAKRIKQAVRHHGVDLLHAHQYTPFFYAAASRLIFRNPRIIFTEHGRHYPDYRRPKRILANRFLLGPRDRATAVGSFVKQALVNNEGLPDQRVKVIYNGVDPEPFAGCGDTTNQKRIAIRSSLDIASGQQAVLQVARFHSVKDHATAINAFAVAAKAVPSAVLVLAGDGPEKNEAESLAAQLGVADQIRFLGVRQDIPDLMRAADVFLLSSLSEGISVTLLEAMASSLPIVATEVGGNPEVVEHGKTGFLSPRRDAEALGANLIQLLKSPDECRRMGQAGLEKFQGRFTQSQMHRAYEDLYREML